jgi:DNA-binding CsgD family transcriptional regulator
MSGVEQIAQYLRRYGVVFFGETIRENLFSPKFKHTYVAGQRKTEDRSSVLDLEACLEGFPSQIHFEIGCNKQPLNYDYFCEHAPHAMKEVRRFPVRFHYPEIVDGISIPLNNPERGVFVCGAGNRISDECRRRVVSLLYMFDAARRQRQSSQDFCGTPLSEQQIKVARMASTGMSYDEIAKLLGISEVTVRFHLAKARERFGLASNMQFLVAFNRQFN